MPTQILRRDIFSALCLASSFFFLIPTANTITAPMSGIEKIRRNRLQILAVASRYGAEKLQVFGSVARNEDGPESDIDLLVKMPSGRDLLDIIALSRELEELLHQKTEVISDEELSPYLKERILREAVAV